MIEVTYNYALCRIRAVIVSCTDVRQLSIAITYCERLANFHIKYLKPQFRDELDYYCAAKRRKNELMALVSNLCAELYSKKNTRYNSQLK